MKLHFQI
ncbi:hypothetical protein BDFB_012408 [Asbolus verrucosus]|nr:hypothetical protein BDFB_012408 [Asbolus verrucosus]